jgi:hypothetical protein
LFRKCGSLDVSQPVWASTACYRDKKQKKLKTGIDFLENVRHRNCCGHREAEEMSNEQSRAVPPVLRLGVGD